jgi:hypothetical protein
MVCDAIRELNRAIREFIRLIRESRACAAAPRRLRARIAPDRRRHAGFVALMLAALILADPNATGFYERIGAAGTASRGRLTALAAISPAT